jgi:succinoglycan biosynthesis protein ExoV
MPIVRSRIARDFVDAIDAALWPRLLHDFERTAATHDVHGVGAVLSRRSHALARRQLVLGAGADRRSARVDAQWNVAWVRGPRSARRLRLPEDRALADASLLLRHARPDLPWTTEPRGDVVLMPRYAAASRGDVRRLAALVGAVPCDPASPLPEVVRAIAGARLLVTECVHGALLAELLNVPWRAFASSADVDACAWLDACDSFGLRWDPILLPAPLQSRIPGVGPFVRGVARRMLATTGLRPATDGLAQTRGATDADVERAAAVLERQIAAGRVQACTAARLGSLQGAMLDRLAALHTGPRARRTPRRAPDTSLVRRPARVVPFAARGFRS